MTLARTNSLWSWRKQEWQLIFTTTLGNSSWQVSRNLFIIVNLKWRDDLETSIFEKLQRENIRGEKRRPMRAYSLS